MATTEVGVLDRSVAVLDAVDGGSRTHAAIVRATGLSRTTAHRLLTSLVAHGLLEHDGGGYRLGPWLLDLAASAVREPSLREAAHPVLERLATTTGESAQLYVVAGDGRTCVDAVESSSELRTFVPIGEELPLWAGSAGKVFLAGMPPGRLDDVLRRAHALTSSTPTGDRLRRQLAPIRRRGWAASFGERQDGVGSVSAPVHAAGGDTIAAVSISGPTSRIRRGDASRYAPAVVAAAREIERALGFGLEEERA